MKIYNRFGFQGKHYTYTFKSFQILYEKAISVVPWKENVLDDISNSFLFKAQVLGADDGRVNQVKTKSISSEFIDNLQTTDVLMFLF